MCTRDTALHAAGLAVVVGALATASAAITPHIVLSRTSGVAPLAVFADATTTEGLDGDDYVNAHFGWDFDQGRVDPDGKHSPTRGFVAAHVYENPGTYTVALTVIDRQGATASATTQVTVSVFSGTTYYVATGGSNSAAGTSMGAPLASPDYAVLQKAGPNTRILLRRGDRFTVPSFTVSGKSGPVVVGAYTDPNRPSAEAPVLFCTQDGYGIVNFTGGTSDWRLMDIHLRATTDNRDATPAQRGFTLQTDASDILLLRVEVDSVARDAFHCHGRNQFVFDCYAHDFGCYCLYSSTVNRTAMVGTVCRRVNGNEHFFRVQGGSKAFFAYNDYAEIISTKSSMQVRGTTSQVYLLGNRVERAAGFHPQNDVQEEYVSHCVADGNTFIGGGLGITATHIAVRNNLFSDCAIGLSSHPLVGISDDVTIQNNSCHGDVTEIVSGIATNTVIKNNVFHSTTTMGYAKGLYLDNALSNYQVDNNVYYAPDKGGPLWFTVNGVDLGRTGFDAWQAAGGDVHGKYANPLLASTDLLSPGFLRLTAASPARGAGAPVSVFVDRDGAPRIPGQVTDAGALLYGSSPVAPGPGVRPGVAATRSLLASTIAYDLRGRKVWTAGEWHATHAATVIVVGERGAHTAVHAPR